MIVDLSCPIELRGYELLMDDNGHTRAYIRLFNLSERAVVAYSATTRWYNGLTRADVTENITVDEMLVKPRSGFKLVHSLVDFLNADHVEMYFTSVTFEDGAVWKPEDGDLVEIGEQPVLQGEALDRLRAAAGDDAVQYPQTQKNFWRCVCGRINLLTSETCARCGRDQREVLTKFNEKAFSDRRSRAAAESAPGEQAGKAESVRGARGTGGGDRRADAAARAAGVPARAHERKGRFDAAAVCDGGARV